MPSPALGDGAPQRLTGTRFGHMGGTALTHLNYVKFAHPSSQSYRHEAKETMLVVCFIFLQFQP